jgi:peptide/nickel transport system substrate-binding protein
MRHLAYLCLALSSSLLPRLHAATRPHYGGTLRVQVIAMFPSPEALPLVSETLVRFDEHGDPQPALARGWQSDTEKKRWRFIVRPKAAPASAIAAGLRPALRKFYRDVTVTSSAQSVVIQSARPMPDLLERLARPEAGVPGTGPFRLTKWEPGRRAVLTANEDYPGGRPFVDAVEFSVAMQRTYQAAAADLWELPVGIGRRSIPEWMRVWTSAPLDLIALSLRNPPPGLRDALSLSIDRAAIVNVLTQRRGEVASGLLPQWLTGYEFLFPIAFGPARAREIATSARAGSLTLSSPPSDALARSVADRVVLNARDGNITVQAATQPAEANIQLLRLRLGCAGAGRALREIAGGDGLPDLATPEALYSAEKALLDEGRLIPIIHVPQVFGVGPRVHSGMGLPACGLLDAIPNLWLTP